MILFIFSLLIDLSKDVETSNIQPTYSHYDQLTQSFQVKSYRIEPHDTFQAVVFKINNRKTIDMEQALLDFYALNPKANHNELNIGDHYLWPKYDEQ
ncbi:hypothetical protein [Pelagirhabdus alkalitolerans]|uniref:hypothetical protein n=1 Tax=Pelagirhabdus alkalitolerans TaxID=1612202 RepID=UPI001C40B062|nr:hypothetical protein [Pelagirhabdus alkalitolerans]